MIDIVRRWLVRRQLRRKVPWEACAWSPQKAAEKRLCERLVQLHMQITRIQMSAVWQQMMAQMSAEYILRKSVEASADRARAEYEHQYSIFRKRQETKQ